MSNSITHLNHAPLFEWYVGWCGSNNRDQTCICLKEIRQYIQTMITILNPIANIIRKERQRNLYDHLMSTRIFTLIMNKTFIRTPRTMKKMLQPQFKFANFLILITCSYPTRSGASWEK